MKKVLFLIVTTVLAVTIVHAQSSWVTYKADEKVSLKFPTEPKDLIPGTVIDKTDTTMIYIFTVVDFLKLGVDPASLASMQTSPEFAGQLKVGMSQTLPDVVLEDFKIGAWKGLANYTTAGVDSKKKKYDMFMFITGNKLYSLSTIRSPDVGRKNTDDFFASAEVH